MHERHSLLATVTPTVELSGIKRMGPQATSKAYEESASHYTTKLLQQST